MNLPSLGRCLLTSAVAAAILLGTATSSSAQNTCSSSGDPFLNPFTYKSAHNRPIGTGARYADSGHPATRSWQQAGHFNFNVGGPWGVDLADADGSDPMVTVNPKVIGPDKGYGLPTVIRMPREGLKTRVQTNKSGNTDGVAVIVDRTNWRAHQLRQYNWNNGNPTAAQYRSWNVRGLGHGVRPGDRVGTSASGVAAMFGVLRGHEINRAGHKIEHALQIALPRVNPSSCNVMLSRQMQLPATSRDATADRPGNNTGNIPYGALLALPPSVNINSLGLSEPGRRLAEGIRNYGIYVVDGGGCAAGGIRTDQFVNGNVLSQLKADIRKIYPHIRMVLNNDVLGNAVAGGGSPLAPNCAFDAKNTQRVASSPQSGNTSKPSTQQGDSAAKTPSEPQSGGGSSDGGTMTWSAVPRANNYYVEVRDTTSQRNKVYGKMVPPADGGCAGKGQRTCSHSVSSLPEGRSYRWTYRAVVDGKPQEFSPWQPLGTASSGSSSNKTASSPSDGASKQQTANSKGSSQNSGGKARLAWSGLPKANNYYVEVRDTTSQRNKVYGKMVPPTDGGCIGGGTCSHLVSLDGGRSYQWTYRPVVNGKPQSFAKWRPVP